MKRISLLVLGLCATAWASGCCCHGYYSRYSECDDTYVQRESRVRGKHRNRRSDRAEKCNIEDGGVGGCCDSCCESCCDGSGGTGPTLPSSPMTYDNGSAMLHGAPMGGGCAACGTAGNSMPMSSGMPQQMYGGMPFDPGQGWTIQSTTSTPAGNEPVMAPPSTPNTPITPAPARTHGWAPATVTPSSAPSPGPVPPPVSYNR
jgi:hypothetical protein